MGCGATKEVETKYKQKEKKEKREKATVLSPHESPTTPARRTIYDRKCSMLSEGVEMEERVGLGRTYQLQVAILKASVVDAYKDAKFSDEQTTVEERLSDEAMRKIMMWLQGMEATPVPIVDSIIDDRPGTPEGYYRKLHVRSPQREEANSPQGDTTTPADDTPGNPHAD